MTDTSPGMIGQTLRNRRLQKSLTLENVMNAIRIQPRYLKALEEEAWDQIPARVFLEGFLSKYAEFLGLDPREMLGLLRDRLGQSQQPAFTYPGTHAEPEETDSMLPIRLGLLLLAVLIVGMGGLFFLRRQGPTGPSLELPLNQVTETEPLVPSTAGVPGTVNAAQPARVGPHTVVLRAKESVWLRVRLDGAVRYEGTLPAGEVRTWPFDSVLRVRAGNLSRLVVSVDGTSMDETVSTSPGDVVWPPTNGGSSSWARERSRTEPVETVRVRASTAPTSE